MAKAFDVYENGVWHPVGSAGGASVFTVRDGLVCIPASGAAAKAVVGGTTKNGNRWYQLEYTDEAVSISDDIPQAKEYELMDEPYVKEWGWQCCLRDAAKGDRTSVDLYRWIYRCAKQRFTVKKRVIVLEGNDGNLRTCEFTVDNGAFENESDKYGNYGGGRYILIPLIQFPHLEWAYIDSIAFRVKEDNPELLYQHWPNDPTKGLYPYERYDGDLYALGSNGDFLCLKSIVPTEEGAAAAMEVVSAAVETIKNKLADKYGIVAGDKLDLQKKLIVTKVIHDYIVTVGYSGDDVEGKFVHYYANSMHSVFTPEMKANCGGYTQAFNYVARMFGIESIYMSGTAYVDKDVNGTIDSQGGHTWNAVRLSDDPYGSYPTDPKKWSCIDVYWDEPNHEIALGGTVPDGAKIIWDYYLNIGNIFPNPGNALYKRAHREINTNSGYGYYPTTSFDGKIAQPELNMPYNGNTNEWEV